MIIFMVESMNANIWINPSSIGRKGSEEPCASFVDIEWPLKQATTFFYKTRHFQLPE